ncbi:phage protein [Clostridioides difficile]|nr:phage protein [Clostridioides difficile]
MYENNKVIYNFERCEKLEKNLYLSQFNTYKNFKLTSKKTVINSFETYVCNMNIRSISLVDTIECISLEDEQLTGKKLILVGDIDTDVILDYVANKRNRNSSKKNILKLKIPFSTFIQIPRKIENKDKINLKYLIQDISSSILDDNNLFISVTAIISYENSSQI